MKNKVLCSYGCNKEAKFYITKQLKPCCSKNHSSCKALRNKNSKGLKKAHKRNCYKNSNFNLGNYLSDLKISNPEKYKKIRLKQSITYKKNFKLGLHKLYNRKLSEETKEKIRQKRIEYLKLKTGQTAWERRSQGKMSYLEKWFYDEIIIKENLLSKYDIVNEYSEYPYFIDFAFLNIKLAVELDGACHFNNGNRRKENDLKKNKLLKSKGWNIFRIAHFEDQKEVKARFLELLKDNNFHFSQKIYNDKLIKYLEIKKEKQKNSKTQKTLDLINKRKQLILESNIDFTKKGWSGQVNKLTNLGHSHVTNFLRIHLNDLFQKAYKRKGTKIK